MPPSSEEETIARNDGRLAEVLTGGKGDDDDNDYIDTDFDAIPIVDLSPSLSEDEIALRIGNACRDVGFFYVINHRWRRRGDSSVWIWIRSCA